MGNEETTTTTTSIPPISDKYSELISLLKNPSTTNVTFLTGAGISTSAGIPDFRSTTGIFSQVQSKYNLKSPISLFHLTTFYKHPEQFYDFCKVFTTSTSSCKPTTTHLFMGFLCKKNKVLRIFTQNVDALELQAGVPRDKVVFAHGNITEAHCPKCNADIDVNAMKTAIMNETVLYCPNCNDVPCKPKVVFYGEQLPEQFNDMYDDIYKTDLAFVIGTSLHVYPFSSLVYEVPLTSWRVLINKEKVGNILHKNAFQFSDACRRDIFISGYSDEVITQLIKDCGWENEFNEYISAYI